MVPRTNEAPRIVMQLSVGFRNHEDLFVFLGSQMKQEIDFTLEAGGIQGNLLATLGNLAGSTGSDEDEEEGEEETETATMTVNGEDGQKVIRRRRNNGAAADAGAADPKEWAPHFFALNDQTPGLCGYCHYRETDPIHIREEVSPEAQALIDASRETPATEAEAATQEEAAARLAARSR